jgi:amino acid adenylation domain-containing protein
MSTQTCWQGPQVATASDGCVHEQISQQAVRTPHAQAVVFEGSTLSYSALDHYAEMLAQQLIAAGVGPEARVGIFMDRSLELVVAVLGVLKAGAAYVPLDPEYPAARVAYMLHDAQLPVVLTQPHLRTQLDAASNSVVWVVDLDRGMSAPSGQPSPAPVIHGQSLAYCIYTSGSTGRPKAVGNTHAGLLNRLRWMQAEYALTAHDSVLQKTPFSFDVSVWELLWPLMQGARLVLANVGAHRDPAQLAAVIEREAVTTLHFVPSMLQAFVTSGELPRCTSVKQVMCSGEALSRDLVRLFRSQHGAALHNLYGPTEAAIDVTSWRCEGTEGSVPIGRPIWNTQLPVLDEQLQPVAANQWGELYIAGANVSRGYVSRPGLTAERYVPNPWGPPGSRMYRTGDLVRYRPDGALEYQGRLDDQVKLRGLRIELGEIESQLRELPQLRDAAVLVREDTPGQPKLVGYVVWHAHHDLVNSPDRLSHVRASLQRSLPEYMVPALWVELDALPLSPSGKLDRRALPAPLTRSLLADVAPTNDAEAPLGEHDPFARMADLMTLLESADE